MRYSTHESILQGVFRGDRDVENFVDVQGGDRALLITLRGNTLDGLSVDKKVTQQFCRKDGSDCETRIFTRTSDGRWGDDAGHILGHSEDEISFTETEKTFMKGRYSQGPAGQIVVFEISFGDGRVGEFTFARRYWSRTDSSERVHGMNIVLTGARLVPTATLPGRKYLSPIPLGNFH